MRNEPNCLAEILSTVVTAEHAGVTARAVWPGVVSLRALAGQIEPWDGLIHRRMSVSRLGPASPDLPEGEARLLSLPRLTRGSWELTTPELELVLNGQLVRVRHWLARSLGEGAVEALASMPEPIQGGPLPADAVLLRPEHIAAWAAATGDDNRIHTVPGEAARCGLEVSEEAVVAHGLLLAALAIGFQVRDGFWGPANPPASWTVRWNRPVGVGNDGTHVWAEGRGLREQAGQVLSLVF